MTAITATGGFQTFDDVTKPEARRLGRYNHLVRLMQDHDITEKDFQQKVARWKPFRGERLAAAPPFVLDALRRRRWDETITVHCSDCTAFGEGSTYEQAFQNLQREQHSPGCGE